MRIEAGGVSLFYEVSGAGEPLLLLHGNGEDHHVFDALARRLSADFTLYALDSRNHGESQRTQDYSYRTMAQDVYAFLRALELPKAHIVGFSDGAIVALLLAMEHGEVLGRMALLGVNLSPADFKPEIYRALLAEYERTKNPLVRLMLEEPSLTPEDVRSVSVPALLIAGEEDIFLPESFRRLARALPQARLKVMAGHGHDSYLIGQELLYPDLVSFFRE